MLITQTWQFWSPLSKLLNCVTVCQTKSECFWPRFLCGLVPPIPFLFFKNIEPAVKKTRNTSTYLPSGVRFIKGSVLKQNKCIFVFNHFRDVLILAQYDISLYVYIYHNKLHFPGTILYQVKKIYRVYYQISLYWKNV